MPSKTSRKAADEITSLLTEVKAAMYDELVDRFEREVVENEGVLRFHVHDGMAVAFEIANSRGATRVTQTGSNVVSNLVDEAEAAGALAFGRRLASLAMDGTEKDGAAMVEALRFWRSASIGE